MSALVPFAGVAPGMRVRFSRGYAITGKVHASVAPVDVTHTATALCGRKVRPLVIYNEKAWPTLVEEHGRLHATHEVYTCDLCVRRAATQ